MNFKRFTFNYFQENTYIIWNNNECVIIDPGCSNKEEENALENFIKNGNLKPLKIINTHCHIDHIFGNYFISNKWKTDLYIHKKELDLLKNSKNIANEYGIDKFSSSPHPTYFLKNNEIIDICGFNFKILFTPGHSPGHICLYNKENKILFGGDVLFKGSIGRTDLPGGDYNTLIESIQKNLLILDDEVKVLPGHGDATTIGFERKNNPFLI